MLIITKIDKSETTLSMTSENDIYEKLVENIDSSKSFEDEFNNLEINKMFSIESSLKLFRKIPNESDLSKNAIEIIIGDINSNCEIELPEDKIKQIQTCILNDTHIELLLFEVDGDDYIYCAHINIYKFIDIYGKKISSAIMFNMTNNLAKIGSELMV